MKPFVEATQSLGRALMLPIAVLPIAALLLRLGQPDLLNLASVAAAGDVLQQHHRITKLESPMTRCLPAEVDAKFRHHRPIVAGMPADVA